MNKHQRDQKEAYIGIRLMNPQISMQDGVSKAQALITSEGSATAVFFAYSKSDSEKDMESKAASVQISSTGGKWNTNIVKNELCVSVERMNLYVAPTYINLEKPTFWKTNKPKVEERKGPNSARDGF